MTLTPKPHIQQTPTRVWLPWQAGPEPDPGGPVFVSLTRFVSQRTYDLPGIAQRGVRLGLGWYAVPGAIGLRLWGDPMHRQNGSLSVWTDHAAMQRWVGLPRHVAIMDRYRTRGHMCSAKWEHDRFEPSEILTEANRLLNADALT